MAEEINLNPAEEPDLNPTVNVEHGSAYSFKIDDSLAAQLIFTAGFVWPELMLYNPRTGNTDVVTTAPNVLIAIGQVLQARLEVHPAEVMRSYYPEKPAPAKEGA